MLKIYVDLKRYDELVDPETHNGIFGLAGSQAYDQDVYKLLLNFVVLEDGTPATEAQAREIIRKNVTRVELRNEIYPAFRKAILDAFVNPTNGSN